MRILFSVAFPDSGLAAGHVGSCEVTGCTAPLERSLRFLQEARRPWCRDFCFSSRLKRSSPRRSPVFRGAPSSTQRRTASLFFLVFRLIGRLWSAPRPFGERTTCTQRLDNTRFYQIGSAAVGAGAEAAFFSRGASAPAAAPSAVGGGWALSNNDGARPQQNHCNFA